jgi:flagellar hook-associated protein 1 FlgK
MVGLNSTLTLASGALSADSGALAITNNNIANVNTTGYSRQIVNLSADALDSAGTSQDNGVSFGGFTSVRDAVLQLGIQQKTSDAGSLNAQSALWSQIETGFSSTSSGLGSSLSNLFSAFSGLSTTPGDDAARQSALSSASNLVDAFHQAAATLSSAQTQADAGVSATVAQINQLSKEIAGLDGQLSTLAASGQDGGSAQDGGSIQDQRDTLTAQLAQLTGLSSTSTQSTPSLSTANGSPLVIGQTAFALQVSQGADGKTHIFDSQGQDITASLTGGSLGGALTMRDSSIPQLSTTLDGFASQFAAAMNTAQTTGYDANGSPGQAMFNLPSLSTDGTGAAAGITLALTSTSALAISSDGTAGNSGNVANLLAVQTQALSSGQNPTDTYASFVETIGNGSASVTGNLNATQSALTQLTTQQASESGVSIDEETTNLLRYQQAYTAAAKVISTINSLYTTLMNMSSAA